MSKRVAIFLISFIFVTIAPHIFSMAPEPALHVATRRGDLDEVKRLVEHGGVDVNEVCERTGYTALHHAISLHATPGTGKSADRERRTGKAMAEYLLENGAAGSVCVNGHRHERGTPLHIVLNTWHPDNEVLDVLLRKGQVDKALIAKLILYRVKNDPTVACLLKHLIGQE